MKPIALIQLVSEQTMQNLLPALALRPARIVHLATPKVAARSRHVLEALRQAGHQPESETMGLSAMPHIEEARHVVCRLIAELRASSFEPVLNFTGSTKLISIGAYEAAAAEKVPSVYVDTEHGAFVDGGTGSRLADLLPGSDLSLTTYVRSLRVDIVAAAHGCGRVTASRDWKRYAKVASLLINDPELERQCWEAAHGPTGLCPGGREPRNAEGWAAVRAKPVSLPDALACELEQCGILRSEAGKRLLKCENLQEAQFALGFMSGAWWEVAVMQYAAASGLFRDLRWSVNVGDRDCTTDLEEDILGLLGARILYVSCKRGGLKSRIGPLLDEIESRATRIGGRFTRKMLAIYLPLKPRQKADLARRAAELGIALITCENVKDGSAWRA